ncbi:TlyA family RNA methyltransferase [Fusobacterium polymorphum]|uniref:TlyA family RNA methyltransferase n=1 Tax=Fusobacterium nucleatum subsp. polymorphum TaxID=76857 RepID=UPI00300B4702
MTKFLKNKMRLDEYLVENEYFENLEIAKRQIMVGNIIVNEQKIDKPGEVISLDKIKSIRIKEKDIPYVSRGGFTDCSLQNGAKFVYAIDVGTNQLDWKLRNDSRVRSIENKHINDLEKNDLQDDIDIIVMDISFISIKKVLYKIKELLKDNGFAIFLIKPQFEAERNEINKGIVDSLNVHKRVINEVIEEAKINQLFLENLTVSPIRGTKGNIEYLAKFSNKNNFSSTEEIVNRLFNN